MTQWDGNESSCSCDCGFDIPKGGHLDALTLGDISGIADLIYPVGSIYMSVNASDPSTLFGGSWSRINDRFLLAAGSTYSAGSMGGAASAKVSISAHTHTIDTQDNVKFVSGAVTSGDYDIPITGKTNSGGGTSTTISTMPPYMAVYVWQRIA